MSTGVPQESILGPVLWNIIYDGVLRLNLPAGVKTEGFADDVMLEVTGDTQFYEPRRLCMPKGFIGNKIFIANDVQRIGRAKSGA